jgi:hypothetical protein
MFRKIGAALILLILCVKENYGDTPMATSNIPVQGVMQGVSELSLQAKRISDNVAVSSITWDPQIVGAGWQKAPQYVELSVRCNYHSWKLLIYSSNTAANTGQQKGGLLSLSNPTQRLSLGWLISDGPVAVDNRGDPGELITNTVSGSTATVQAAWKYLKDIGDLDNPDTYAWDESWTSATQGGYTTILYGNPNTVRLPYNGLLATSPVSLYLEADFSTAEGNALYENPIYIDMIFQ